MTKERFQQVEDVLMGIVTDKASTVAEVLDAVSVLREFESSRDLFIDSITAPCKGNSGECCAERCSND